MMAADPDCGHAVTLQDVQAAAQRISGLAHRTPVSSGCSGSRHQGQALVVLSPLPAVRPLPCLSYLPACHPASLLLAPPPQFQHSRLLALPGLRPVLRTPT